jgi:hypothetical protein
MLRLRDYIKAGATPPPATATIATSATEACRPGPSVATVAGVAVAEAPDPASWLASLRSGDLPCLPVERWAHAADALESLMHSGAVDKALGLGWDTRELVGVRRRSPHDAPSQAGLIFSMKAGDSVSDVRRAGCVISYANVRHIWKRVSPPADGSLVLPWDLPGATPLPQADIWET